MRNFASVSPKEFFPGFPHLFFMNSLGRFWSVPHQFFGTLSDLVFLLTEAHSYETRRQGNSKFQVLYVLLLRQDAQPLPNHPYYFTRSGVTATILAQSFLLLSAHIYVNCVVLKPSACSYFINAFTVLQARQNKAPVPW